MEVNKMRTSRLVLVVLLITILSNLPVLQSVHAQSEVPNPQTASEFCGLTIETITYEKSVVKMSLQLPLGLDDDTLYNRLLLAMYLVIFRTPDASQVIVDITYLDLPYARLTADASSIRQTYEGNMDIVTFFDQVHFEDLQSIELVMLQTLNEIQISPLELKIDKNQVYLLYKSDAYADRLELFEEWQMVLNIVANLLPSVKTTIIEIVVPEEPGILVVTVNMTDFERYNKKLINELEFLLSLEVGYGVPTGSSSTTDSLPNTNTASNNGQLGYLTCGGILLLASIVGITIGGNYVRKPISRKKGTLILLLIAMPACVISIILFILAGQ